MRVSILLTCYNHLPYLKAAWQGIQSQTFQDFEVLALDDGSSDGTRQWLASRTEPVHCHFHEKNLGTYGNLNFGVEHSSGEYLAILNDDDLWAPEKLARQVALMDADPSIGLIGTGGWFIDDQGGKIADEKPLGFVYPRVEPGARFPEFIAFNRVITSSVLIRRSCFEKCGLFDAGFYGCGDWQMWLRVSRHFKVGYVDEPLTFYRVHGANACLDEAKMNEDTVRIREWIPDYTQDMAPAFGSPLNKALALNWAALGTEYKWLGRRSEALNAYRRSISTYPLRLKTWMRLAALALPEKTFRALR